MLHNSRNLFFHQGPNLLSGALNWGIAPFFLMSGTAFSVCSGPQGPVFSYSRSQAGISQTEQWFQAPHWGGRGEPDVVLPLMGASLGMTAGA